MTPSTFLFIKKFTKWKLAGKKTSESRVKFSEKALLLFINIGMLLLRCSRHKPDMGSRPWLSFATTTTTVISILLLFPAATTQAQILDTEQHFFGPFGPSYFDTFQVIPNASISLGALQVTPDTAGGGNVSLANTSGRVLFKQPFKLWENDGKVASFNTSFLINIFRPQNNTPGEGLAFVIAPTLSLPQNSHGQYLGLTNSTTDGSATNQIVAIELDTVKQDFDPDDNHIGLDINSVRSKVNVSLSQLGIQIAPNGTQFYVLWVEYDGARKALSVFMTQQPDKDAPIVAKPSKPVLRSTDLDLKSFVNQRSYFGFSASTGITYELNCILRWNISVEILPVKDKSGTFLKIGLGVGVPLFLLVVVGISGYVYYICKKKRESTSDAEILGTLKSLPGTPREFRFQELKKATNNFDEKNKLGQGGFGVVYRGTLQKDNLEVAVKMFSRDRMKSTDDFLAELTIINRLRHKHLVRLLGWCRENGVLLLVYDYMPNGSLDNHIFCEEGTNRTPLSWHLRYKIISGVASALNYLHNEYDQKVVHRDLKASNIMLDSDFNARLGDFGLARALENEKTSYAELEGVPGTMGYIAPECFHTGKATRESDVYGFGAVLLEVVCGQRPWTKIEGYQFLVDWVWYLHRDRRILDAVDQRLADDYVVEEAEMILKLGLACSHAIATERPKMQTIVQILSGSVPVPHVPPFKPAFVWPAVDLRSFASDLTTATSTDEHTPINTQSSLHGAFSANSSPRV